MELGRQVQTLLSSCTSQYNVTIALLWAEEEARYKILAKALQFDFRPTHLKIHNIMETNRKSSGFISEKKQPYLYMKVSLTVDDEDVSQLTPVQYKYLIMQAVKETLGQVGVSYMVDVLKLSNNGVALLRLPTGYSEKLWAALTMYGTTPAKKRCAFRVLQVSPFLMGLVFDSRWQR